MIIIKLKGGLGNQLFQYAYERLLSVKNGVEVKYEFCGCNCYCSQKME